MTAEQLALDWADETQPTDRPPTPFDLRQAEIQDMSDQGPGPKALWAAHDVPTNNYL